MQRLIDTWAGVEESVIQNVVDHRRRYLHTYIQPQNDIMIIHYDKISMIDKIKLPVKFIVK